MRRIPLVSLLLLAVTASPARSQDIGTQIGVLTGANAELFVGPLARGLGHALTAGFVSSADPHGMFGFDLGVRVAAATFPEADETFQVVLPSSVTFGGTTYQNPYEANNGGMSPTVAGAGTGVRLKPRGDPGGRQESGFERVRDRLPRGARFPGRALRGDRR